MKSFAFFLSFLAVATAFQPMPLIGRAATDLSIARSDPDYKLSDMEMEWFLGHPHKDEKKVNADGLKVLLKGHRIRAEKIEEAIQKGMKELPHNYLENAFNLVGLKKDWYEGHPASIPKKSFASLEEELAFEKERIAEIEGMMQP